MKLKYIILLALIYMKAIATSPGLYSAPLFDESGNLNQGSIELCEALGIEHEIKNAKDFNRYFQENLLRPKNKERWHDYETISFREEAYEKVFDALKTLHMFDSVLPEESYYDYIVIFGTSTQGMTSSCAFVRDNLKEIIERNPKIIIFFLTGERLLTKEIDSAEIIKELINNGLPCTETFAAKIIWRDTMTGTKLDCRFVNINENEVKRDTIQIKRPNTADTAYKLLSDSSIIPGRMLGVSINPFISYQHNVLKNILEEYGWFKNGGTLTTVGGKLDLDGYCKMFGKKKVVQILLDNVARCAYEEIRYLEQTKHK